MGPYQLNAIVSRWYIARERALRSRIDQNFCLPPMLSSCRLRYLCVEQLEAEFPTPPRSKRYPTSLNPYQLNDIVSRWNSSRGRALGRRNDQHFSFLPMRTSCRRLDSASISTTIRSTAFSFVACVTFVFVVGIGVLDDLRYRPQEVLELLDAFAIPANIVKHPLFVMRFVPTGLFQVLNKLITVLPLTFRA